MAAVATKVLPAAFWTAVIGVYAGEGMDFRFVSEVEIPFILNADPTAHAHGIAALVQAERGGFCEVRAIAYDGLVRPV